MKESTNKFLSIAGISLVTIVLAAMLFPAFRSMLVFGQTTPPTTTTTTGS